MDEQQVSSAEFLPNFLGFDVHSRDRLDSYEGVFIAAKHELAKSKDTEMISGAVKLPKQKKLITAACYRPPKGLITYCTCHLPRRSLSD